MPPLKNVTRETLALALLKGISKAAAAKEVGLSYATVLKVTKEPAFTARMTELRLQQKNRMEITADRVKEEIARIAFLDPADLVDKENRALALHDIPEDARRAIGAFEMHDELDGSFLVKFKPGNKEKALELLGRHFGLFPSDASVAVNTVGPVQVNIAGITPGGQNAQALPEAETDPADE